MRIGRCIQIEIMIDGPRWAVEFNAEMHHLLNHIEASIHMWDQEGWKTKLLLGTDRNPTGVMRFLHTHIVDELEPLGEDTSADVPPPTSPPPPPPEPAPVRRGSRRRRASSNGVPATPRAWSMMPAPGLGDLKSGTPARVVVSVVPAPKAKPAHNNNKVLTSAHRAKKRKTEKLKRKAKR